MSKYTQERVMSNGEIVDYDLSSFRSIEQVYKKLEAIELKLTDVLVRVDAMTTAFVNNDLGKPDYDGHRKEHLSMAATKKTLEGYKEDTAKKVLGISITVIAFLLLGGIGAWIKSLVK